MSTPDDEHFTLIMRRGDRLPMLATIVEDDDANPVDLTGATANYFIQCADGMSIVEGADPPVDHRVLPAAILSAPAGLIGYDWQIGDTENMPVGQVTIVATVTWPDGGVITAPTKRVGRLIIRPGVPAP